MGLREVVLDRDIRAAVAPSRGFLLSRYLPRRIAGVAVLVACDLCGVLAAVAAGEFIWPRVAGFDFRLPSLVELVSSIAAIVLAMGLTGLYGRRARRHSLTSIATGGIAVLFALALVFALIDHRMGSASLLLLWLAWLATALILRRGYDAALALVLREDLDAERLLVVGSAADGPCVRAMLSEAEPRARYVLTGTADASSPADLEQRFEDLWPSTVVIADLEAARPSLPALLEVCRRRHVTLKVSLTTLADDETLAILPGLIGPVFTVRNTLTRQRHFAFKRAGDVTAAGLGLVLLSPLFLAVALAIKLTSKGPVIYASRRVGLGQRVFSCYKFRTMCVDAEDRQADLERLNEAEGCLFKIADDPRITGAGKWLRRYSLDELPQLYNVVRGDMSLVGPRPLPIRDVELMKNWEKRRHLVLPGLTGLWQTTGRSNLGFDDMMELDSLYIESWTLRGDLAILARTAGAVFAARGAC
jgi:exopolysaccharide biosynthesis polyprenyl glycosylphosphotransferase